MSVFLENKDEMKKLRVRNFVVFILMTHKSPLYGTRKGPLLGTIAFLRIFFHKRKEKNFSAGKVKFSS